MNVVILDGDVSYPPTSGKRLRTLNLMLGLAPRHRITYIARGEGDAAADEEARAYLAGKGIEARIVDAPLARKKGVGFYARLLGNLLDGLPYSVTSHRSEAIRRAVREVAASKPVDLWQVEWAGYLYALQGLGAPLHELPIVLQAHNVDALLWRRYSEAERNALKRWYIAGQWRKFHRFEADAFRAVKRVVAVSAEDAALAREWYGVENVDVVDNGVDVSYFRVVRPRDGSRSLLFLGALDWRPNLDALDLLLGEIFPAVSRRVPEARLVIVGRNPPAKLRQRIAASPGVELHADVPDVRPYMESSAAMAVPLRIGGGSRLKILESLAAGLPVVSTRVGAEGLALRPGHDYTLADTPEEMADRLVDCLSRPEAYRQQAEEGRKIVASRYDWSSLSGRLERVWERVAATAEERRA
jgi:glycosyltransferase involved in cell wall biosynthesis